ncbi:GerMN domain-containing protein [Anaerobacillus isosaccharinicus]|uniref:GerMN domain-containing protein n=1 Tax=Anaerobacillus isosaccharinicus TaxID=1532552 RepID=A0A1S2MF62_9BACI|nr:GerMN domain-containing protein [Anaerobacillus isosaccharinicus]MBA5587865.1 GerMN domain-containing protein [Anaerobacillus isosaccharinicus]QOY33981.1 GerMN domain-containing protein [Anaerobacillus isosaccharinicus]
MRKSYRAGVPMLIALSIIVSGCSLGSEKTMNETDPPPVSYVDESVSFDSTVEETSKEMVSEMTMRELYLIDQNGLVAPQALQLPKSEGVARQALEYLVQDGPVSELLPNGFQAVLPAGTEIFGVNIKDGVAIADFSEQFKDYRPEDELKILQSITWTLTQFESVETVKIRINGYDQEVMPVNGTPIGEGFSRANGINMETNNMVDVSNSKGVTLYFLSQNGENVYYVPVTRRVNSNEDQLKAVVSQLLAGPSNFSNLLTDFRHGVQLIEEPRYANGVVTVNFNEALLNHIEGTAISEEVLNLLVLSLTEQAGVEKVAIEVNGDNKILMATGEFLSEPVARPLKVNSGKY